MYQMVFFDYKKALEAAKQSGGTIKANPSGQGWVLFNEKRSLSGDYQHARKPKVGYSNKYKPKPQITPKKKKIYFKPRSSKFSKEAMSNIKGELSKNVPAKVKPDPKHNIPEHQRRKTDEGFAGSREDWKKNRRGYYGDMK